MINKQSHKSHCGGVGDTGTGTGHSHIAATQNAFHLNQHSHHDWYCAQLASSTPPPSVALCVWSGFFLFMATSVNLNKVIWLCKFAIVELTALLVVWHIDMAIGPL